MSLIAPVEGEANLLGYMLGETAIPAGGFYYRLYTAPISSPTETIVRTDLTEVTDYLYAPIQLTPANWVITEASDITTAEYNMDLSFYFGGASSVYGYYVTNNILDNASTTILWIERFNAAPFSIPSGGGTITITPRITLE